MMKLAILYDNFPYEMRSGLLHLGLLGKEFFVLSTARMVIEANLGIRLKDGDDGLNQARRLSARLPQALQIKKV